MAMQKRRPVAPIETEQSVLKRALSRILQSEMAGSITSHLQEVLDLSPEEARVDVVTFQGTISAAGVITQPGSQRLNPDFVNELFAIHAWRQTPATDPALLTNASFNIRESGRNFDLFANDLPFAAIADTAGGGGNKIVFDRGLYTFRAGSEVNVTFSVDSNYAGNANNAYQWGVALVMNLVRK